VDSAAPATARRPFLQTPPGRVIAALASLRLTVVLFALSMVLVFVGTLAQMDAGVWTVVNKYFRSFAVWVPFQLFVKLGQVFFGIPKTVQIANSWGFPFPGGWTLGSLLLINLLAAHLTRFKLSWKRSGILVLHAGMILMLLGELVTGLFAVEARMTIAEGETVNFADQSRAVELTVTDSSDPTTDDVVAVPGSLLRPGKVIQHAELPVDVEVQEYLSNSDLVAVLGGPPRRDEFVSMVGARFAVVSRSEGAGVDVDQREDAVTARVKLLKKGTKEEVGTYLVSLWFYPNITSRIPKYRFPPQTFTLDGKTYTIELRPKRDYKPYSIHLIQFKHEKFLGTDTPKNYESLIRLTDPARNESREQRIYMNAPMRRFEDSQGPLGWLYNGETYFQSSFLPPMAGTPGTVFQVVRNPGWLMPYISCVLVAGGMMIHFGITLFGFLQKRAVL
jgi:hypothetical protein